MPVFSLEHSLGSSNPGRTSNFQALDPNELVIGEKEHGFTFYLPLSFGKGTAGHGKIKEDLANGSINFPIPHPFLEDEAYQLQFFLKFSSPGNEPLVPPAPTFCIRNGIRTVSVSGGKQVIADDAVVGRFSFLSEERTLTDENSEVLIVEDNETTGIRRLHLHSPSMVVIQKGIANDNFGHNPYVRNGSVKNGFRIEDVAEIIRISEIPAMHLAEIVRHCLVGYTNNIEIFPNSRLRQSSTR